MSRALTAVLTIFLWSSWVGRTLADDSAPSTTKKPAVGITVWDTGRPAEHALAPSALAGTNDWAAIPYGTSARAFTGDAVMGNGRLIVVVRQRDSAVEVHALKPDGAVARLRLGLQTSTGEAAARLERVTLHETNRGRASLDATFKTAQGAEISAQFRIRRGDDSVQVAPGAGAGKLRVESLGRFVILPDFFADDIVVDATKLPLEAVELPSENFVLHLTGDGNAIAMCLFENRQQDIRVTLAGSGAQRQVTGSEIGFEGKNVWVALLDAPHIWHAHDVAPADTGKVVPLDWKMPFPAQWRVDFGRANNLTDSWEMLLQEKAGDEYVKPSWLGSGDETLGSGRGRWNTVLGDFRYPCWSDPERRGYFQPLKNRALRFEGPALIYPINRVQQTPVDRFTVVDVMRSTLGTGPCEHILDVEGQKAEYRGRATCSVRDTLNPIYTRHEQKRKHDKVNQTLDEGLVFVKHIRGRITRYVEFGNMMRAYLTEQKKAHPEAAEFIVQMQQLNDEIDQRVAARRAKIHTPAHVAEMNAEFRKDVLDYEGPDAFDRCRKYTRALVEIGDNQDELSAECRWVVKTLRQRAGILMALDPRVAPIATEIRARTQVALRYPANHEGARH